MEHAWPAGRLGQRTPSRYSCCMATPATTGSGGIRSRRSPAAAESSLWICSTGERLAEPGMVASVNVVIVGGHGKIALRLEKLLAERGDSPRGIIRKTEQASDLEQIGAEPIVLDIENVDDIGDALAGSDAAVFAAGAGPGSGPARERTVDYGGAVKLADACRSQGIRRYVMVSSIGSNRPENWSDEMRPYQEAKSEADRYLTD